MSRMAWLLKIRTAIASSSAGKPNVTARPSAQKYWPTWSRIRLAPEAALRKAPRSNANASTNARSRFLLSANS